MFTATQYGAALQPGFSLHEEQWMNLELLPAEIEVQAAWFAGEFGREFTAVDGHKIHIHQHGLWNHEAGPDFLQAAIQIDDQPVMEGAIEIDSHAKDWEAHGHHQNPEYENVILHLFLVPGSQQTFTRTPQHRLVPQALLPWQELTSPPFPLPNARPGRCVNPISSLSTSQRDELLHAAAAWRLNKKRSRWQRMALTHGIDQALFQATAEVMGYRENKLPFRILVQRLPLKTLRTSPAQAEALLFGGAGFLQGRAAQSSALDSQSYLRDLWEVWWKRQAEFQALPIADTLWSKKGFRPLNHPERRLGALATLLPHWQPYRALMEEGDHQALSSFLAELTHPFWSRHYRLDRPILERDSAQLMGSSRIHDLLANVMAPLIPEEAALRWLFAQRAPQTSRRVAVALERMAGGEPRLIKEWTTLGHHQALLQLFEDYCLKDFSDCTQCGFPSLVERLSLQSE
ncbi:MAG: DUF2851 family protein [Verrucomicrobiales bacterium]